MPLNDVQKDTAAFHAAHVVPFILAEVRRAVEEGLEALPESRGDVLAEVRRLAWARIAEEAAGHGAPEVP